MSYRHWLNARTWVRIFALAFVGLLLVTMTMRVHAIDLTPLPAAPATGWCYAGTVCNAQRFCTYAGVQACPTQAPGPDYCGQVRNATVGFANGTSYFADLARFENLLGKTAAQATPQLFPAAGVSLNVISFGKSAFISAKFTVPPTIAQTAYGTITIGEPSGSRKATISLSPSCGFSVPVAAASCVVTGAGSGQGISWKVAGSAIPGVRCPLLPGASYFLNIKFDPAPPASDTYNCSATACKLPIVTSVQR